MNSMLQQNCSFRGMLLELEAGLEQKDLQRLAFYYKKESEGDIDGLKFFRDLLREGMLSCDNRLLIIELINALEKSRRADLKPLVEDYMNQWDLGVKPAPKAFAPPLMSWVDPLDGKEQAGIVSSSEDGRNNVDDCQKGLEKVMISGLRKSGQGMEGYQTYTALPRGKKRRKIDSGALDERELSYEGESSDDEPPQPHNEDDEKFMKIALEEAKKSPDKEVQVGAAIVDPNTKQVLGVGCNRMPKGCEEFPWSDNVDEGHLNTKRTWRVVDFDDAYCTAYNTIFYDNEEQYQVTTREEVLHAPDDNKRELTLYVFHGAKAAIKDAFEKKNNLEGSILYTTLFPANTDAQWIVDCGIKEMVYLDNLYKKKRFCKAAKLILDTVQYRKMGRSFEERPATE